MIRVQQGDAFNLPLEDNSIDLVVTSPPYFAVRAYKDNGKVINVLGNEEGPREYVDNLVRWMGEMRRVIKPTGSVFVVLGDKYAGSGGHNNSAIGASKDRGPGRYNQNSDGIRNKSLLGLPWRFANACVDEGWVLRQEIIWSKPNGMPESVKDRTKRAHETIFHFTKEGRYYSAIDRLRSAHAMESVKRAARGGGGDFGMSEGVNTPHTLAPEQFVHPQGALPTSVWTISTSGLQIPADVIARLNVDKHYAAFPPEIPRRIIEGWCPVGICDVCGEGRRPLIEREPMEWEPSEGRSEAAASSTTGTNRTRLSGTMTKAPTARAVGEICACTPFTNHRGKRGDWRENRTVNEDVMSDDWSKPGIKVPRRPGGFGTRTPAPEIPRLEYHLGDWTPPSTHPAVVLDPFGGAGTTALVARLLGRDAYSFDISSSYTRLALWRVFASDHYAKLGKKWSISLT